LSFFSDLKKSLDSSLLNKDEESGIPLNSFNFIRLKERVVSIYLVEVTFLDILNFFQSLIPWVKLTVKDLDENYSSKFTDLTENEIKTELYDELIEFTEREIQHFHDAYPELHSVNQETGSTFATKH
jgi:hypothetical protein